MHRDRQRYGCQACGKKFQYQKHPTRLTPQLWHDRVWKKQTLKELSQTHSKSIPWIRSTLETYTPKLPELTPTRIVVVIDGFFFTRGSGVMLFRDPNGHNNVLWFPIAYETIADYLKGIEYLETNGWTIQAVVCDGRQGVKQALSPRYPIQMCHFHQVAIVTRYLTRNPKLPAAIELRALTFTLTKTNEPTFTAALAGWHAKWHNFLKEKTINSETKGWFYTHKRVRGAYRSLNQNLPYLFTYQKHPHPKIPNTTNSLDGSISHLRDKLRAHRGLNLTQRLKITGELLKGKSPQNLH